MANGNPCPDLKPCPFCGSNDLHPMADEMLPDQTFWGHVECSACDAQGPGDGWAHSAGEAHTMAITAWNRRTLPEGMALVPQEITAESGHKAGMMGDFVETIEDCCPECGGSGHEDGDDCELCEGRGGWLRKVTVTWTTIKAIHRRIVELSEDREP